MSHFLRLLTITLLWSAFTPVASAQSEENLQRHTVALENLHLSVDQLGSDNTASIDALESAASTMRLVARDTASTTLVQAMEAAFDNARTAITNQSRTDLAVQAAVLRGGFQRALLESSLDSTDVESARPGFSQLAAELGLDVETIDGIAEAGDLESLLLGYQAGLARSMSSRLDIVQSQFPESQESAYITLAGVYGMSLSLQDAPRTPAELNSDFAVLIQAVVDSDAELVADRSASLATTLSELGSAAPESAEAEAAPPEPAEEPVAEPVLTEPEPVADTPAPEPAPEPAAEPAQAEPAAQAQPEAAADPEPVEPAEAAEAPAASEAEDDQAAPETAFDLDSMREQLEAEQEQVAVAALVNDLGRRGVRGQAGENLAAALHSRGYSTVSQAIGDSLELVSRASAAAFSGNQAAARQHLSQLSTQYQTSLQAFVAGTDPSLNNSVQDLLAGLQDSPSLSVADLQALTGLLVGIGATGSASPALAGGLQGTAATWTTGWPRLVLLVIAALLTILPLTFLRLAFGGGNRNWSLIGTGLFLLLLPVILGGLAAAADLIGHLASLPVLQQAAAWVNLEGSFQQALLLIIIVLAIILLAVGLYGICKQFGLFGGNETGSRRSGKRDAGKTETKTLVDWDEEF